MARRADVSAENVEHPKRAAADIQHTGSVSDVDPVQKQRCLAAVQFTLSEQPRSLTLIGAERVLRGKGSRVNNCGRGTAESQHFAQP